MQAVIDLGSNTFNILIADIVNKQLSETFNLEIPVKIAKGGINNNIISQEAFNRGMMALEKFNYYIDTFKITEVTAYATSAIRNAQNGAEFIAEAQKRFNIFIEPISGDTEAKYIYYAAINSFNPPDENILVMDIGGGSVEFIVGKKDEIIFSKSFEIGAVRLVEQFQKNNPITDAEIEEIEKYIAKNIKPLIDFIYLNPVRTLVGTAGSFETLVDVVLKDFQTIPVALTKNAFKINNNLFDLFYALMVSSNTLQREKLKGLVNFRVETIVVASILINFIKCYFNIEKIIASNYALNQGVIFAQLYNQKKP